MQDPFILTGYSDRVEIIRAMAIVAFGRKRCPGHPWSEGSQRIHHRDRPPAHWRAGGRAL